MESTFHQKYDGNQGGYITYAVLITCGLLMFGAAVASQNAFFWFSLADRSHAYRQALALAEAGAEEAIRDLNQHVGMAGWSGPSWQQTTWGTVTDLNGHSHGSFDVLIRSVSADACVIESTGRVGTWNNAEVTRTVRVGARLDVQPSFFNYGLYMYKYANFGQDFYMDSWNSATDGLYSSANKHSLGNVGGHTGVDLAFGGTWGDIYGSIQIGGQTGNVCVHGNNVDGEPNTIIENSPATPPPSFPDAALAAAIVSNNNAALGGAVSGGQLTQNVTMPPGVYYFTEINIPGNEGGIEISPPGEVVIYLEGNFTTGDDSAFNRNTMNPGLLKIFQKSGSISWGEDPDFYGALYSPNGSFTNDDQDPHFYGAMVLGTLYFGQNIAFHYDENLGAPSSQGGGGVTVTSWTEGR